MNRIELNNALDALQDVAGDASDLVEALYAAKKLFDWAMFEALGSDNFPDALKEAISEALSEAYDREAKWTGRA